MQDSIVKPQASEELPNTTKSAINITPKNEPFLLVLDDIFTPEQCKTLIKICEAQELEHIDRSTPGVGNITYDRAMLDNKELAATLYKRLRNYIPQYVDGKRVHGLNNYFRFSKYYPGGEFAIHKDGINQDVLGNRSIMTLNIFLNDDFEGGETDFFHKSDNRGVKQLRRSVKPKSGSGALFYSQQYHRGNKVTKGIKYLLRTDVMVSDF